MFFPVGTSRHSLEITLNIHNKSQSPCDIEIRSTIATELRCRSKIKMTSKFALDSQHIFDVSQWHSKNFKSKSDLPTNIDMDALSLFQNWSKLLSSSVIAPMSKFDGGIVKFVDVAAILLWCQNYNFDLDNRLQLSTKFWRLFNAKGRPKSLCIWSPSFIKFSSNST